MCDTVSIKRIVSHEKARIFFFIISSYSECFFSETIYCIVSLPLDWILTRWQSHNSRLAKFHLNFCPFFTLAVTERHPFFTFWSSHVCVGLCHFDLIKIQIACTPWVWNDALLNLFYAACSDDLIFACFFSSSAHFASKLRWKQRALGMRSTALRIESFARVSCCDLPFFQSLI